MSGVFKIRLKQAMAKAGVCSLALARKIGVAHTTVGAWLNGAMPGAFKLCAAAEVLGVQVDWFFENLAKIKAKRLSQYRAAKILGVTEGHLSRVRRGERCSKRLLERLAELEKQHGPIGEGKHGN